MFQIRKLFQRGVIKIYSKMMRTLCFLLCFYVRRIRGKDNWALHEMFCKIYNNRDISNP